MSRRAGRTRRNLVHAPRPITTADPLDYRVAGDPGPDAVTNHGTTNPHGTLITISAREARLRARKPKTIPLKAWREVADEVVGAILAVPETSQHADDQMHTALSQFAWYCVRNHGLFEAQQHLDDAEFTRFIARTALTEGSKNTYHSRLRYIAAGGRTYKNKMKQPNIGRPYSPIEFERYVRAAFNVDSGWGADALMLLDLAGRLGLSSSEIASVTGQQIERTVAGPRLHIANKDGTLREIPIIGQETVRRLEPHIGSDKHLLRPGYRNRRNVINDLVTTVAQREPAFRGFQVRLARHMWIADLMRMAVPTRQVIYLAGLRPGTNTVQALTQYIPDPDADLVHKTLISAHAQKAARQ